jgi:anthranilate phosphoribosyltransferase
VAEIHDGAIRRFTISADDFGIGSRSGDIPANCTVSESAALIAEIINNERVGEAVEALVLINAAAAIHVAGKAENLADAYEIAENGIRSGNAGSLLNRLKMKSIR